LAVDHVHRSGSLDPTEWYSALTSLQLRVNTILLVTSL
jgi:hypothetical protein